MSGARRAPSIWRVIWAIARREIAIALKRRQMRFLFLVSLIPPIVFAVMLVARVVVRESAGIDVGWDPVLNFLQVQAFPVVLLALGLGTPGVARDRAEDVLFLYATRPVSPFSYALGKFAAVGVPAVALLVVPGTILAILRQGVLGELVPFSESVMIILKVTLVALFMSWAFAGISVAASAATKRERWAALVAILIIILPDAFEDILFRGDTFHALGPATAVKDLLTGLFESGFVQFGLWSMLVLAMYGVIGLLVVASRVRREMTP
jgi:ABC-type transport system involved in multi-copper enzyme maturation permease subunit